MDPTNPENLVSLKGPLYETIPELNPTTIQTAAQITRERRTNHELRDKWFWTGDCAVYRLDHKVGMCEVWDLTVEDAVLDLTKCYNPIFHDIEVASDQIRAKRRYVFGEEQLERVLAGKADGQTLEVKLRDLDLRQEIHRWYFDIPTDEPGYNRLNPHQRKVAEWVYGAEEDFPLAMKMLREEGGILCTKFEVTGSIDHLKERMDYFPNAAVAMPTVLRPFHYFEEVQSVSIFNAAFVNVCSPHSYTRGFLREADTKSETQIESDLGVGTDYDFGEKKDFSVLFGSNATNYGAMFDALRAEPKDAMKALTPERNKAMYRILTAYVRAEVRMRQKEEKLRRLNRMMGL